MNERLKNVLKTLPRYVNSEDFLDFENDLDLALLVLERISEDFSNKDAGVIRKMGFDNIYRRMYKDNPYTIGTKNYELFQAGEKDALEIIQPD